MGRRSSKLPSSSSTAPWLTDTIPDFPEQLLAAAASCGMRPDEGQAKRLRQIVDNYVFSRHAEGNAAKIREAKNVVDALKKQFEAFQAALNAGPPSVRNEIDAHIEDYLAKRNRFELRRVGEPQNRSENCLRPAWAKTISHCR